MSYSILDSHKRTITPHSAPHIRLEFGRNDVFVEPIRTKLSTTKNHRTGLKRPSGSIEPSRRSMQSLHKLLRNSEVGKHLITLTYQESIAPRSDRELKQQLSKFTERAGRNGIRGVWILEFTEKGIPHIHIVSPNEDIDRARVLAIWQSVTKQHGDCVHIQSIYRNEGLEGYLGKSRTKHSPEAYGAVGRWYGTFGKIVRRVVEFAVTASLSAVAPVLRIMERISGKEISRRFRQTLWSFSRVPGRLECIRRYALSLGDPVAINGALV